MAKKTIETRFSQHRIAPFGEVGVGDLVYLKESGGDVLGQFRVKKVIFIEGMTSEDMDNLYNEYGEKVAVDSIYWQKKKDCIYGTLIFIGESERLITSPIKIRKKDQRGWVVLVV